MARLRVWQGWNYGHRYEEIFGRLTYRGAPVHGFRRQPGAGFARLLYLDALDVPAYGPGWRRENSFVSHDPTGVFCYGFYPRYPTTGGYDYPSGQPHARGPGIGTRYRITAQGPGVTPDVRWEGSAIARYSAAKAAEDTRAVTRERGSTTRAVNSVVVVGAACPSPHGVR